MTVADTVPARTVDTEPADYTGVEELCVPADPSHTALIDQVRKLVAERHLGSTSARTSVAHLVLTWGPAVAAASIGAAVNEMAVWVVAWLVIAWVLVGNAAISHEAVHGHLFASRKWNNAIGTVAALTILASYATFRCYHLEHHARTARDGDPERTPLNFSKRSLYVAVMVLGGLLVLFENTAYTVMTVVGRPPTWVRTPRQRRTIRLNALVLLAVVGAVVAGLFLDPWVTINVWLIPYVIGVFLLLPLLLVPEHYGATGRGDILDNTRSLRSNAFVRWAYWNNNFHAAHHLVPTVPYDKIEQVDQLLEEAGTVERVWRLHSYTQFHWGTLTRLVFNRPDLWVPNIHPTRSRDQSVLVNEAAEDLVSS
jgi:fatty acid desaturase